MTRASVRDQIAERALLLFDRDGFDETTVDDIAVQIGLSARSFFRYFPAKEDVVLGDPAPLGQMVRDAATQRPQTEPVWVTLRRALDPLAEYTMADSVNGLRTMRVLMSTPTLRARNLEKHIAWAKLLEPVIQARLHGPDESVHLQAQALVHAALACLDVAFAEWTRLEGSIDVSTILDQTFGALGRVDPQAHP